MLLLKRLTFIALLLSSASLFASSSDFYPNDLKESGDFEDRLYELLSTTHVSGINYKQARIELFGNIHLKKIGKSYGITEVYCKKTYTTASSGVGPGKIPNHADLNCEHTWPKSRFNPNESKNKQLTDLHHLYPTDSVANSTRSNHLFSIVKGKSVKNCDASRYGSGGSSEYQAFEPPADHRGNVARALFYFSVRYNIEIQDVEEKYLRKWHKADPVDAFERKRNDMVEKFQGNRNPFTDNPQWVNKIENF